MAIEAITDWVLRVVIIMVLLILTLIFIRNLWKDKIDAHKCKPTKDSNSEGGI